MSDFRGADLSTAVLLNRTNFRKAKYDQVTRWPTGFVVENQGLVFEENKPDEDEAKTKDAKDGKSKSGGSSSKKESNDEAAFQKLDKNGDGILSGNEMKGFADKDNNEDGEVSLAEFLK